VEGLDDGDSPSDAGYQGVEEGDDEVLSRQASVSIQPSVSWQFARSLLLLVGMRDKILSSISQKVFFGVLF
jgi:hypothetical protein